MIKRSLSLLIILMATLFGACATPTSIPVAEISAVKGKLTFIDFYSDECPNCMVMVPIVQGLETRYRDQMMFQFLNIDTDGKSLFDSMGLRGNPVFLIMQTDGTVVYIGYGKVPELSLDRAIRKAIGI